MNKISILIISLLFASCILQAQVITTVAGGDTSFLGNGKPASTAEIVVNLTATDGAGNIYFSDGKIIKKISTAGILTTVAGGGDIAPVDSTKALEANFYAGSMAVDSTGNIFITNQYERRVLRIDPAGYIHIFAGNGSDIYQGDGSVATATGIGGSIAVATDRLGNVYITDNNRSTVRKVDTAGIIHTVAGNGTSGYSGDGSSALFAQLNFPTLLAADKLGNLFIYDVSNRVIRKVNAAGIISTVATNDSTGYVLGLAADGAGNLFVVSDKNRVFKIDTANAISLVAGTGSMGFSGDGGVATAAQLSYLSSITLDDTANIYFANGGRIRKINSAKIINTIAGNGLFGFTGDGGPAVNAALGASDNVAADKKGNFYIADYQNNLVRKVDAAGIITTVAGNKTQGFSGDGGPAVDAQLSNPLDVAVDSVGNLYIAERGNLRIRKVTTDGIITTIAGNGSYGESGDGGQATSAQINPERIAVSRSGDVYFSTRFINTIRKVGTDGIITAVAGNGSQSFSGDGGLAIYAQLNTPKGLAIDDSGNIFVNDFGNARIRKVSYTGVITTFAGNGTFGFSGDSALATSASLQLGNAGIATDHLGNVFIADENNFVVRKVDKAGIITTIAGNHINGYSGDGGKATLAQVFYPSGLSVDQMDNLYIAQAGSLQNAVIRYVNFAQVLPVSLLVFNGLVQNNVVTLQWQAANEINTKNFIVQKSADGLNFSDAGSIKSFNTSGIHSYVYTDKNPFKSITFYRLKSEDNDGRFTYSNIIPIKLKGITATLSVYPNPAHDVTSILFTAENTGKYSINISDLTGRLVKRLEVVSTIGINTVNIDVRNFSAGTYLITLNNRLNGTKNIKFNKQ